MEILRLRCEALMLMTLSLLFLPTSAQAASATTKFISAPAGGVPGSYGVSLFAVPAASAAAELVRSVGGNLQYIYQYALNGFQAELSEEQAQTLAQSPLVES